MIQDIAFFTTITILLHLHSYHYVIPEIDKIDKIRYNLSSNILFIIFAPINEEIIFRYALTNYLYSYFQHIGAIIALNALIFGSLHVLNVFSDKKLLNFIHIQIIRCILLGFMLECIYLRHDNLVVCMLLHILFNALGCFSIYYYDKNNQNNQNNQNLQNLQNLRVKLLQTIHCIKVSNLKRSHSYDQFNFDQFGTKIKCIDAENINKEYQHYIPNDIIKKI
jgi:hypothetical protein